MKRTEKVTQWINWLETIKGEIDDMVSEREDERSTDRHSLVEIQTGLQEALWGIENLFKPLK